MKIMHLILVLHCLAMIYMISGMNVSSVTLPKQFFIHSAEGKCFEDDFEWIWNMSYICCRKDNVYGGYKIIWNGLQISLEEFFEESQAKNKWQSLEKTLYRKK